MALRQRQASSLLALSLLGLVAWAGIVALDFGAGFAGSAARLGATRRGVGRAAYESGKVNAGVETTSHADAAMPPPPVLQCDQSCMGAILTCLEDGCSVEALATLDERLAEDEQKVASSIAKLQATQKTAFREENVGTIAWLTNFLGRSGSLRAQLQALRGFQDSDFVKQMVKAAAMAFGGGRKGDYPKVGVSPYSS